jgi:hypothetical protein
VRPAFAGLFDGVEDGQAQRGAALEARGALGGVADVTELVAFLRILVDFTGFVAERAKGCALGVVASARATRASSPEIRARAGPDTTGKLGLASCRVADVSDVVTIVCGARARVSRMAKLTQDLANERALAVHRACCASRRCATATLTTSAAIRRCASLARLSRLPGAAAIIVIVAAGSECEE